MRISPCIFLLLLCSPAFAQPKDPVTKTEVCIVDGVAEGSKGELVRAYLRDDYITGTERLLGQAIVNDSGRFHLEIELEKTLYLTLRCNKQRGYFFAEPGRNHRVGFPKRDSLRMINPDMEYDTELQVYSNDSTEMNMLAIDYNARFEVFWKKNYQHFLYKESIGRLDTFHKEMHAVYKNVKNPYFLPWMDFSLASLEEATFHSERKLAHEYIVNKPIYYDNNEYMNFFNNFYDNYMYKYSMQKTGERIRPAVNEKASYEELLKAMKGLRWLDNDTVRELVMLKGLFECYNQPSFDPRNILSIAEQCAIQSKVPEHRKIARNIISFYTKLKEGTTAPGFTAYDRKGKAITLENYKGKYVVLSFWASWNSHAVSEIKLLPELVKKYSKKVVFVSVSLDSDTAAYHAFLKANPKLNWTMLHYGFNEKLKADYTLLALPAFFIIDPDGRLWSSPADMPSGKLEYDLYKITKKPR
ncbi:MAG: Redoxin domain-containing protein [Bacteroidetes bacterium]|nr:MAG: Redoxin domain-containing protein [Bacteroidota bacterium]